MATAPGACSKTQRHRGQVLRRPTTKLVSAHWMWNTCWHGPLNVASVGPSGSRAALVLHKHARKLGARHTLSEGVEDI